MKTGISLLIFCVIALLVTYYFSWEKAKISTKQDHQKNPLTLDENYKKQLISKLVTAFADEWMAGYQYWMAAKLVQGEKTSVIIAELTEHYHDELRHANMIATRLIELDGDFRIFPQDWKKHGHCHYDSITNTHVISILKENIKGEQCAMDFYQDLLNMTENAKDTKTHDIILEIFNDEVEHKQDLEKLQRLL
ncbi:MAG: ferritin-like domain-containing protein [bacterium]